VIFVTEKDYARMRTGQTATLTTEGYPGEQFHGRIERIAPVFRQATRQARVELMIENPQRRLKPGMFIRVTVVLDRVAETTIVPEHALTKRGDQTGVFVVQEDGRSVAWRTVTVGIREGNRVQKQTGNEPPGHKRTATYFHHDGYPDRRDSRGGILKPHTDRSPSQHRVAYAYHPHGVRGGKPGGHGEPGHPDHRRDRRHRARR
jgi:multidrug efflux pump subunit AcrA (membrane-fusion protein)